MQTVYRNTEVAPIRREYRNRPSPRSFDRQAAERICDVVYLVDKDPNVREEVSELLSALEMKVIAFPSASEYLDFDRKDSAACVILDISLPDIGGLELQRRLAESSNTPVIFISGRFDVTAAVSAMKAGAIEFLTKPVDLPALVAAVRAALVQDRKQRQRKAEFAKLQERLSLLTPREREVLPLVVGGLLNKQAASVLGISEVTLQIHRSQVTRKMQAESFADLVRMAMKLRIPYWRESQPTPVRLPEPAIFGGRNVSRAFA
jgi:FixJ family two-component response regulator